MPWNQGNLLKNSHHVLRFFLSNIFPIVMMFDGRATGGEGNAEVDVRWFYVCMMIHCNNDTSNLLASLPHKHLISIS